MTATCDLCGTPLVRTESKDLSACAECRLVIANENGDSLSDKRRRVISERMAELESGGEPA